MGAQPYHYIVSYWPQPDVLFPELREPDFCIRTAFQDLRCWIFLSGDYQPPDPFAEAPSPLDSSGASAEPSKIKEALGEIKKALNDSNDGTRSILDLDHIADAPEFNGVGPLADETLLRLYGTTKPTRAMVLANWGFFSEIDRGYGLYIVLYKDGQPDEILFAGYSYD